MFGIVIVFAIAQLVLRAVNSFSIRGKIRAESADKTLPLGPQNSPLLGAIRMSSMRPDDHRRKWDRKEYERLAHERILAKDKGNEDDGKMSCSGIICFLPWLRFLTC